MRGLAQALLLAPVLVRAAPLENTRETPPSTFITFDIPPGFDEDQPKPYTLHLEVLKAPSPCAYPNVKVNDNPLSQGGHTLGRGTFAGDHDATTFIASWSSTCAGDEQLLSFTLESLSGRTLASDLVFQARFRQTSPPAILEVAGNVRVSDSRPPSEHRPGHPEEPPFPPPPHHHVGPPQPHHGHHPPPDEHVLAELRELDCLHHQLHFLKHLIHEKESRLEHEHGIVPPRRHHTFSECDSLRCVVDTLLHRVRGFGGHGHGHGPHRGPRHGPGRHHGPPPTCGAFPFPGHGNHTHGNHTLPPPDGPPEDFPEPPHGPPPPPPFDEPHGPPPPPPFDEPHPPHHHDGPPGPPDFDHEHPLAPASHRRPHPHSEHHHHPPPPPGPPPLPLPVKLSLASLPFVGILLIRAYLSRPSRSPRDRRPRRRDRKSRKHSLRGRLPTITDEEKRAFISGLPIHSLSSSDEDNFSAETMSNEITEFRTAATLVTEMVAAEERRRQQVQQQQQQTPVTPPSPTSAFAEYMADDVLPAYDEHAPSMVVSDGFSSYSPGSSGAYAPADAAGGIDDVLGEPKN
ncbi:hypothetical protein CCHL11_02704 [Colletotrichum chlorophyti]|uniref:Uncharacterized protein n=1 Tax=Colletotrichum chlorophyti TaxID=708187 RepID=A0A1Q8S2X2_9PEZI|nr:hypothetical protein CCHL11_02704 [Colletotrichum chlorophyti]